jgi:hypothetical protein
LYDLIGAGIGIGIAVVMLGPLQAGMVGAALGLALPIAVTGGVLMPAYACRLLDLDVKQYVGSVAPGPLLSSTPFAGCLLLSRYVFPESAGAALAAGLGAGGLVLAVVYWRWVLPETLKRRALGRWGVQGRQQPAGEFPIGDFRFPVRKEAVPVNRESEA